MTTSMNTTNSGEQWQHLCAEFRQAQKALLRARTPVDRYYIAVGQGRSSDGPPEDAIARFDKANEDFEAIKKHMDAFIKAHA